jgi:hypothetical protein
VSFSTEALDHPIVAYFNIPENRPYMSSPKFYRAFSLNAQANGGSGGLAVVARFEDGRPAIVERKIGLGRVVVFASTADIAWNNFAMMPAYLPVMRRTIEFVTAGARAQRNIDVHTPIRATVDLKDANARCTVLGPRGGRRSVEPTPMQEWAEILLAETPFRGFYGLTIEKSPPEDMTFAANCNTKESRLDQIDEAELRKRYPNVKFTYVNAKDDLKSIITSERVGVEIWPYLLALIFALLLAESYLAARWAPKE